MECLPASLAEWSAERIDRECRDAYGNYERLLKARYVAYFANNRHLRCRRHAYSAATIAAALPPEWEYLQRLMPPHAFHRYARSGRSSQLLALALLGSCSVEDPSLGWLMGALGLRSETRYPDISPFAFEYPLEPSDLGEEPRVTTIDYIAQVNQLTAVVECKWSERGGLGRCSCLREDGSPEAGSQCASRVRARHIYWQTAHRDFGLPIVRDPGRPCSLSLAYQAIRNVAAARFLSENNPALFVLLFDENNPYFRRTGNWPGWPAILEKTFGAPNLFPHFSFKALSWQQLVAVLPLPPKIRKWAFEKHGLGQESASQSNY
jgi:hypothetical protein